jgi:hypothetical protein
MVAAYGPVESALIDKFVSHFSAELNGDLVKAGKLDELIQNISLQNADYGVLLEFNGGIEDSGKPFVRPVWIWETAGIFLIRYRGDDEDIETKLRDAVDKLAVLFEDDHTIGGTTPFAKFRVIDPSEPAQINDISFYWVPFVISFHAR